MSLFSWLTGSGDTANKVVDGVSSGLDMLFFTEEEKSIASQKVLDFKIEYAKATQGQSIARRIIATIVSGLWGLVVLLAVITGYFSVGLDSYSDFLFKVLTDNINPPFMIVIGFYFLAHVVGKVRG